MKINKVIISNNTFTTNIYSLTDRQQEVMELLNEGCSLKEIAGELEISDSRVQYIRNLLAARGHIKL